MLPRFLTSNSTKSSCSRVRRPIQPRLNCPSMTIPLWGDSSRVTINSLPLTGSLVISGYICCSSQLVSRSKHVGLSSFIRAWHRVYELSWHPQGGTDPPPEGASLHYDVMPDTRMGCH